MEEAKNDHKRAQLRKLAEINGTLRDQSNDEIMGDQSAPRHLSNVCRNCGSGAHPTYDCVSGRRIGATRCGGAVFDACRCAQEGRGTHVGISSMTVREYFDQEYVAFCMAVGEKVQSRDSAPSVDAEAAMTTFYEELGV